VRGILQRGRNLEVGGPVRLLAGPFAEQLAIWIIWTNPDASGCFSTFSDVRSLFRQGRTTSCRYREQGSSAHRCGILPASST
jgi:hypothetical protein